MENRKELGFQAPISGVVAQVITSRYRLRQKLDVKYHYFASISVKYSSEQKNNFGRKRSNQSQQWQESHPKYQAVDTKINVHTNNKISNYF